MTMQLWLYGMAVALTALLAIWGGRGPERASAVTLLVATAASAAWAGTAGAGRSTGVDPITVAIDTITWLVLAAIAMRANRVWPLFLCALQTIIVVTHIIASVGDSWDMQWNHIYRAMLLFAQIYEIPVLLAGLVAHAMRERRIGRYPDWRMT